MPHLKARLSKRAGSRLPALETTDAARMVLEELELPGLFLPPDPSLVPQLMGGGLMVLTRLTLAGTTGWVALLSRDEQAGLILLRIELDQGRVPRVLRLFDAGQVAGNQARIQSLVHVVWTWQHFSDMVAACADAFVVIGPSGKIAELRKRLGTAGLEKLACAIAHVGRIDRSPQ